MLRWDKILTLHWVYLLIKGLVSDETSQTVSVRVIGYIVHYSKLIWLKVEEKRGRKGGREEGTFTLFPYPHPSLPPVPIF